MLPGEIGHSDLLEDAEHWVAVYDELTRFLAGSGLPWATQDRYRRRLAFWRCRRDELRALGLQSGPSSEAAR